MSTALTSGYSLHLAVHRGETVKQGSKDDNTIRSIQEALSAAGWELEIDGDFGPDTARAVRQFQRKHGLDVTGEVGEKTLDKLSSVKPKDKEGTDPSISAEPYEPTKTVKDKKSKSASSSTSASKGSSRATKGDSKDSSTTTGKTVKVNGVETHIDPRTDKPIATSGTGPIGSTKKGAYGAVNPDFEQAHPRAGKGNPEGGQFIKKGDEGPQVEKLQGKLNDSGAKLKTDGVFGPKTQGAVKDFQGENKDSKGKPLATDGVVGFLTAGALHRKLKGMK